MRISSISSNQNLAISNRNLYRTRQQMNSGKKINTAADDAAGLAIAQKLLSQSNSLKKATDNAATFQDMSKIAEGALGTVCRESGNWDYRLPMVCIRTAIKR